MITSHENCALTNFPPTIYTIS